LGTLCILDRKPRTLTAGQVQTLRTLAGLTTDEIADAFLVPLATMAQRLGKRALEEGKIITFEPMSPRDRRIVHLALAKFPGVVTKSDGEGEGRRVQIIPVRR